MDAIQYTFDEAEDAVVPFLESNYAVLFRGRHGIGKSQFCYQISDRLDLPVVERRASQMTDGDLLGLPDKTKLVDFIRNAVSAFVEGEVSDFFVQGSGENETKISRGGLEKILERLEEAEDGLLTKESVTKFCPPAWFKRACEEPVLLFLDELDRASLDVRQGIFELSGSRKLFGRELHPDTRIVSAINGGVHSSQYQVSLMGPAELDRWVTFDIRPDVDVWLDWASESDEVISEVWDFINSNRNHLYHSQEYEDGKVYPTPRSWARFSNTLKGLKEKRDVSDIHSGLVHKMAGASVGLEAAKSFRQFWDDYDREMTCEQLLGGDWKKSDLDDWGIPDFTSMIKKLENDSFQEELDKDEIDNLFDFWEASPAEPREVLVSKLGTSSDDHAVNAHNIKMWFEDKDKGQEREDKFRELIEEQEEQED